VKHEFRAHGTEERREEPRPESSARRHGDRHTEQRKGGGLNPRVDNVRQPAGEADEPEAE
jgi:hypothetical protein